MTISFARHQFPPCRSTPSVFAAALTLPPVRISARPAAARSTSRQLSEVFPESILCSLKSDAVSDLRPPQRLLKPPAPIKRPGRLGLKRAAPP